MNQEEVEIDKKLAPLRKEIQSTPKKYVKHRPSYYDKQVSKNHLQHLDDIKRADDNFKLGIATRIEPKRDCGWFKTKKNQWKAIVAGRKPKVWWSWVYKIKELIG